MLQVEGGGCFFNNLCKCIEQHLHVCGDNGNIVEENTLVDHIWKRETLKEARVGVQQVKRRCWFSQAGGTTCHGGSYTCCTSACRSNRRNDSRWVECRLQSQHGRRWWSLGSRGDWVALFLLLLLYITAQDPFHSGFTHALHSLHTLHSLLHHFLSAAALSAVAGNNKTCQKNQHDSSHSTSG